MVVNFDYDFSGWATKNDLRCSDGRTIKRGAFSENDGKEVPCVWSHQHKDPKSVLGHAILEERTEGTRAYVKLNNTENGKIAKELVKHGDIRMMSIYANQLRHNGSNVIHGNIIEVSLVHGGANPGAYIDSVLMHGEDFDEEGIISTGIDFEVVSHSDNSEPEEKEKKKKKSPVKDEDDEDKEVEESEENDEDDENEEPEKKEEIKHADNGEETIGDILETLTDKQKRALYAAIGMAVEDNEGTDTMKHNVFEGAEQEVKERDTLSHEEEAAIFADIKRYGSLKESALAHGITDIEFLFPEAKSLNNPPSWISRPMGWVSQVMGAVSHTPFSRIKSVFANITEDEARAKGYIKGKLKKEEVFSLLKRATDPTTIYKKQKFDRDDLIDITDFDVTNWVKAEMRVMLDEELARAILVGDGRQTSSDDKIPEDHIRPVCKDADLYTIKMQLTSKTGATTDDIAKDFIRAAIKSRKNYKGSGQPVLYTTEDMLTDMLLLEDGIGHALYLDEAALARKLRVSSIVAVPVMEGVKGANGGDLLGIIVNLRDYNIGADKGGAVNMFDDFDIDYNQQKYLIETRCSGALTKPYSAIAIESATAGSATVD